MQTPTLLIDYIAGLRVRSGAASAVMLLHMEPPERQGVLLVGDGAEPLPELASEEAAWQLIHSWSDGQEEAPAAGPVSVVPSADENALLIRLAFDNVMRKPTARRREINERRSQPDIDTAPSLDGVVWIGLSGFPALWFGGARPGSPDSRTGAA